MASHVTSNPSRTFDEAPDPAAADTCVPPHAVAKAPPALHVERVTLSGLAGHRTAWADLSARAIEPNVFLSPGFALPLLQHLAAAPSVVLVWEEDGPASFGKLLGLFALEMEGLRSGFGAIARGFLHEQMTSGIPLVDRDRAAETLTALLAWLAGRQGGRRAALLLPAINVDGPFHAALDAVCAGTASGQRPRAWQVIAARGRSILRRPETDGDRVVILAAIKRRNEHARRNRRLSDMGRRGYTIARTADEVAAATERFLALEHRGWKGRRGTSLLAAPGRATFARAMTRLLAATGSCRIDAIEIDGRPVAMGIVLKAGDRAYFWKICFDEIHGALSPGVQLARDLTQVQLDDSTTAMTDSCAPADHPMIDRLWPQRMTVADLMVAVAPGRARLRFEQWVRIERAARGLRRRAKAIVLRLRRRTAPGRGKAD